VTVTLDSGIYISAFEYDGVPEDALTYAATLDELLICTQIEDEVVRVMHDKFHRDLEDVRELLADTIPNALRVIVTGKLSGICRDPNDDFILECAETGKADLIVTGDKDLLSLKMYGTIKILTPRQYLENAEDQQRRN
jgi:putative PIN family toxin of toxin-antitoxin system